MSIHSVPQARPQQAPLSYDHALSPIGRGSGWWRGAVAIVIMVAGYFIMALTVAQLGILIDMMTGAFGPEQFDQLMAGIVPMTPAIFLTNNLALGALLPLSFLVQRMMFGVRPGTISSIVGRFRWGWFRKLAIVIVPVFAVYAALTFLVAPADIAVDGTAVIMLLFILLTTPFQAAAEEYTARGVFQQSAGSWFRSPTASFIVSTAFSAFVFCIAHGAGDPWLVAYYFLFGVAMSFTVKYTGGLEAAVLIHAANNVMLFIPSILTGQLLQGIDRSAGSGGPVMLLPLLMIALVTGFVIWRARKEGIQTRTVPHVTIAEQRTRVAFEQRRAHFEAQAQAQFQGQPPRSHPGR